jgi:hypothetical protein
MSSDQAREVLQLAKGPLDKEAIIAQFTKYYESNDPEKLVRGLSPPLIRADGRPTHSAQGA